MVFKTLKCTQKCDVITSIWNIICVVAFLDHEDLKVNLLVCLFVCLFVCLSVGVCVCVFVCLLKCWICLFVCLSIVSVISDMIVLYSLAVYFLYPIKNAHQSL